MDKLFEQRRKAWQTQNLKYLRYVFNDHFTLFLLILLGALAVQYAQFLQGHALKLWMRVLLLFLVSLIALLPGRMATFVEAADKVFLLIQEQAVRRVLRMAWLRSLLFPGVVGAVLVLIAAPLLRFSFLVIVIWWLLLLVVKGGLLALRLRQWEVNGILQWERMIRYEENRKVSILRFFALFTTVKGVKAPSHRRKYLDFLLPKTKRTYEYLLSRSFLRSGDYLGLTLRLLLLSVLALIFVHSALVAVILVGVLDALLLFQLFSLREAMDYQLLTRIYPLKKTAKRTAVSRILSRIMWTLTGIEMLVGLAFLNQRLYLLLLLGISFVLIRIYLTQRLKK